MDEQEGEVSNQLQGKQTPQDSSAELSQKPTLQDIAEGNFNETGSTGTELESEASLVPKPEISLRQEERVSRLMEKIAENPRILEVMERMAAKPEAVDRLIDIASGPAGELLTTMDDLDATVLATVLGNAKKGKGELGQAGRTARNRLEMEKLKNIPGIGALIKSVGISVEEFSKLEPSQKVKLAARVVSALAIVGFAGYAVREVQEGLASIADIPARIQELTAAVVPDLGLIDVSKLPPKVDIKIEGFRLPDIKVGAPDVEAALKPVFDKVGKDFSVASGKLVMQVGEILTHYFDAAVATAGAGIIALNKHPFKKIEKNSTVVLPVAGKIGKGIGTAIMASEKAVKK